MTSDLCNNLTVSHYQQSGQATAVKQGFYLQTEQILQCNPMVSKDFQDFSSGKILKEKASLATKGNLVSLHTEGSLNI